MEQVRKKNILLTGIHRSGTTWATEMLSLAGGMLHISEPFNIGPYAYALDGLAENWYTYAPGLDQDKAREAFQKVLDGRTGKVFRRRSSYRYFPFLARGRMLIKDPIAVFSAEWLDSNFDLDVVVIVRHPAAFVASLKRVDWPFDFRNLLRQQRLVDDHLSPFVDEMKSFQNDMIRQGALLWRMVYQVLNSYIKKHPNWIVVRHEDLSRAPLVEYQALYGKLDLGWNDGVAEAILDYTGASKTVAAVGGKVHQLKRDSSKNILRWLNALTQEEVWIIRDMTTPFSEVFYNDSDWGDADDA